jgi:hypothetical protein
LTYRIVRIRALRRAQISGPNVALYLNRRIMHSIRGLNFTFDFMTEIFRQQSAFPQMQRFLSMISAEGSSGPKQGVVYDLSTVRQERYFSRCLGTDWQKSVELFDCFLSRLKRGKVSQVPAAAENTAGVLVVTRRWHSKRAPIGVRRRHELVR